MSRRGLAIATACAGGFLAFLDTTIVNTAFPGIAASFPDASAADLAWVLDAYFIVIAALLVPAGGIADRIGRKRVFLAGLALFTGASALCAAAPGLEVLIAARALQGAGAAVIMAVSLALILPLYPVAQRASAVALWGASAALAAASGPPLGGALVELDWRWVFVVNLPLGVAIFLAGRAAFVEQRDERMAGLPDLLGAALVMGGLGLLSLAILEGGTWGWTSLRVLAAFAASAFLLAATAHRCLTHPRPVIDPALLRIGSFARANVGLLLLGMAFFSTILANVLFLVGVWGYSVLTAGLAVVPGAIATAAVAVPAGRIADRYGQQRRDRPGLPAVRRRHGDRPRRRRRARVPDHVAARDAPQRRRARPRVPGVRRRRAARRPRGALRLRERRHQRDAPARRRARHGRAVRGRRADHARRGRGRLPRQHAVGARRGRRRRDAARPRARRSPSSRPACSSPPRGLTRPLARSSAAHAHSQLAWRRQPDPQGQEGRAARDLQPDRKAR